MENINKNIILIINQYAGSPYHGMVYRHYYLSKYFIKNGFKVFIITGFYSHLIKNPLKFKKDFYHENIDGINYLWVKLPEYKKSISFKRFFNMIVYFFKLCKFKILKFNKYGFDYKKLNTIIISSTVPYPFLIGYFWKKKLIKRNVKINLIYEIRDLWPLTLIELGNFSKYNPVILTMQLAQNFAFKKSDYIVTVLNNSFNYIEKHGGNKEKIFYISNGIYTDNDSNYFKYNKSINYKFNLTKSKSIEKDDNTDTNTNCNKILSKFNFLNKDILKIGFAGSLNTANTVEILIDSANLLKQYEEKILFIIAGDGPRKDLLENKVKKYSLNNIIFTGRIEKNCIIDFISRYFDICYFGLKNRALFKYGISSNKLFDYMMAGKPIIFSAPLVGEFKKLNKFVFPVEPENSEELARVLLSILNHKKEKLSIDENIIKNHVLSNYSYAMLSKKYINLFIK